MSEPPDDFQIIVCDKCLRACCWQGEFMCEGCENAGIKRLTVRELKTLNANPTFDGEHPEWWAKDQGWLNHSYGETQ